MPVYDKKYIKAKVREYNGVIETKFWSNKIPKRGVHYTYIACLIIDSFMRLKKKYYPQVYLEKCKYEIKIKMPEFIAANLESDSSSNSEWFSATLLSI